MLDFFYGDYKVRVVGTVDELQWVARDAAEVLTIDQSTLSCRMAEMPDEWKGIEIINTPGGPQQMATLKEPGLYALIFQSRKPEAREFQRWVFETVLPEIRKTGGFGKRQGFTTEEIRAFLIAPEPSAWERRFSDEFYQELGRLTGLKRTKGRSGHQFANLTTELVYGFLPGDIAEGLRQAKAANGGKWVKLHQHLTPDGIELFRRHMIRLLEFMRAVTTLFQLREMLRRFYGNVVQGEFFQQNKQDGSLSVHQQLRLHFGTFQPSPESFPEDLN